MKRIVFIVALVLSGCTQGWNPDGNHLIDGLNTLRGKPASVAVQYLGHPTARTDFHGKELYSWIIRLPENAPDAASPRLTKDSYVPGNIYYEKKVPYRWSCRVDIVIEKNIITRTQYEGKWDGCQTFYDKLKPLVVSEKEASTKSWKFHGEDVIKVPRR